MYTDLPLNDSKDDKLGRYVFASEIASGLVYSFKDNNESIVLGINGTWGSGKSTLINFIINEVKKLSKENSEEIIIIKFNPWMFSGQKELQNIFLKELFVNLERNKEKLKEASKKIADFLGHLNWLKYIHSGTGEAISDTKKFLEGISKEKNLNELKKDIDELLINSKVKLYITIDDIDRLTPSEITDIFQLVKLNGNFANTIFILAYDQDVVTAALNRQFGNNGKKYIEKIVQIDYTLPSISKEDINRIFIDSLKKLFPKGEINKQINNLSERIKNEPFLKLFTSLRDIYRFNNSIKLRLPSIFYELNILDFFSVEALRIFNPEAYQFIINNKDKLIFKKTKMGIDFGLVADVNSPDQSFFEKINFDDKTKEILKKLFLINSGHTYNSSSLSEDLIREKRIAKKNYFDRYFNLQLTNFDIQEDTFNSFININDIATNVTLLKKIYKRDKLLQFLNWVEIKSENADFSKQKNIIISALSFLNILPYKSQGIFGYYSDYSIVLRFCSKMLSKIKNIKERRKIINIHIKKNEKEVYFSTFYIADNILDGKELFDTGKLRSDYLWNCLFSENKEENEKYFKDVSNDRNISAKILFDKLLIDNEYLNEDEIVLILIIVQMNYAEYYNQKIPKLIENDKELIKFLWLSIKQNYRVSSNNTAFRLAKNQLLPGLDIEIIKKRIDNFDLEKFDADENKVIALFNKAYVDGFNEDKYYDFETLEIIELL